MRPPPNRTVFDSESPPPYRSQSALLDAPERIVRCHSAGSSLLRVFKKFPNPGNSSPAVVVPPPPPRRPTLSSYSESSSNLSNLSSLTVVPCEADETQQHQQHVWSTALSGQLDTGCKRLTRYFLETYRLPSGSFRTSDSRRRRGPDILILLVACVVVVVPSRVHEVRRIPQDWLARETSRTVARVICPWKDLTGRQLPQNKEVGLQRGFWKRRNLQIRAQDYQSEKRE